MKNIMSLSGGAIENSVRGGFSGTRGRAYSELALTEKRTSTSFGFKYNTINFYTNIGATTLFNSTGGLALYEPYTLSAAQSLSSVYIHVTTSIYMKTAVDILATSIFLMAGGGGGGMGNNRTDTLSTFGGGGGAGRYAVVSNYTFLAGVVYQLTVGAGGAQNSTGNDSEIYAISGSTTLLVRAFGGGGGGSDSYYTGDGSGVCTGGAVGAQTGITGQPFVARAVTAATGSGVTLTSYGNVGANGTTLYGGGGGGIAGTGGASGAGGLGNTTIATGVYHNYGGGGRGASATKSTTYSGLGADYGAGSSGSLSGGDAGSGTGSGGGGSYGGAAGSNGGSGFIGILIPK